MPRTRRREQSELLERRLALVRLRRAQALSTTGALVAARQLCAHVTEKAIELGDPELQAEAALVTIGTEIPVDIEPSHVTLCEDPRRGGRSRRPGLTSEQGARAIPTAHRAASLAAARGSSARGRSAHSAGAQASAGRECSRISGAAEHAACELMGERHGSDDAEREQPDEQGDPEQVKHAPHAVQDPGANERSTRIGSP